MKAARWWVGVTLALALGVAGCGKKDTGQALGGKAEGTVSTPAPGTEVVEEVGFTPVQVQQMKSMDVNCGNGVRMKLVLIPRGKFQMGSTDEPGREPKEGPRREVTLTRPFYLGVTEVTQAQYEAVMGENPSHTKAAQNPAEWVSCVDAQKFCTRLSDKTGRKFRLPTEAEWEYAARAGTTSPWFWGDSPKDIGYYAVSKANAKGSSVSSPVASKHANPWGLYDMLGNVWEWVSDCDSANYDLNDTIDPTGNKADAGIVIARGGSMNYGPNECRAAKRFANARTVLLYELGFRVVCEAE